jgi:radical SAM protein with 4Fe4S-binding SPASM domain
LLADSLNICCEASISLDLCAEEWAKQKHIHHYVCGRGVQMVQISPLGDLYVCDTWGKTMGNVLEAGSVQAIYNSNIGNYYSEGHYLPDRCRACERILECGGVCAICSSVFGYRHIYNSEIADPGNHPL